MTETLRVLLWHVHGSWTDAFVRGRHEYLLPVEAGGVPAGLGRAGRDWPGTTEIPLPRLADAEPDVVVLQRPDDFALAERYLRRRPGIDLPAVYVEHNAPRPSAAETRHPLADRGDIPIVQVTHFNAGMWDNGRARFPWCRMAFLTPGALHRRAGGRCLDDQRAGPPRTRGRDRPAP